MTEQLNSKLLKIEQNFTECDFCKELCNLSNCIFRTTYRELNSRIVFENQNFVVLPTIGQIVEGYLLILPKKHYRRISELPNQMIRSLSDAIDNTARLLNDVYGLPIFFEHGPSSSSNACGTTHAHIHAVPFKNSDYLLMCLKKKYSGFMINNLSDLREQTNADNDYLLYVDGKRKYVFVSKVMQSQYMRKLIAQAVGKKLWNWKKFGKEPEMLKIVTSLKGL